MTSLPRVEVLGIGLWAPRLPGWDIARRVLAGRSDAPSSAAAHPQPRWLPVADRRRAPASVTLAIEAASQACEQSGMDPHDLPSVFASTEGDLAIHDALCATLARDPRLTSPTKFHNSVHNAAAGYWSIATGCSRAYTAVSAERYTFAAGLLEALTQVAAEAEPVLYVAYDIEACGPIRTLTKSRGTFAVALVLGVPGQGGPDRVGLTSHVRAAHDAATPLLRGDNASFVAANAMAAALPLFEALAFGSSRLVTQALGPEVMLDVQID